MGKSKRSARVEEVRERSELSCISGLFTILDSHHRCADCKLISNARPGPNSLIIDYSRKLDQCSRFDKECQKIHCGENMARSLKDLVREDIYFENKKYEEMAINRVQCSESNAGLIDHCKGLSKKSLKAYELSVCELNGVRSRGSNVGPTSFSIGEIKKMLKHTKDGCIHRGVDAASPLSCSKEKNEAKKKQEGLKLALETNSVREKIDFSGVELKKHGVDAVLEANRLISARLIHHLNAVGTMSEGFISSLDDDCWPRSDSQQMRLGSCSTTTPIERHNFRLSPMRSINAMDEVTMEEMSNVVRDEDDNVVQSTMDSVSENETNTNTNMNTSVGDDVPSTPTSKYQEEEQLYESPVSVLDQFFTQDTKTPSTNMFQTGRDHLKPRRLCFEEGSIEPSPQEYVSQYVHLVIQSCSLTWDELTRMKPLSEELLLHSSSFDKVGFLLSNRPLPFDNRFLFDYINEILSKIHRSLVPKPRMMMMCCVPLEEVVVNEVMREAESYLLSRTHKTMTTLDQLVAKDLADCRLWADFSSETQHIVVHLAEHILHNSILDVILQTLY